MSRVPVVAVVLALLAALPLGAGCSDGHGGGQALAVLADVSGTYADQKATVAEIVKKGLLPKMVPGDSLFLIKIGSLSYSKDMVAGSITLDPRPSRATAQKLAFAETLDAFAASPESTRYTDIRGALMLAADYLREAQASDKVIVVFSDMDEDLPRGTVRSLGKDELSGMRVLAMNVKRLKADNANPTIYRERIARWEKVLTGAGAVEWRTFQEPDGLLDELERGR